MRRGTALAGLRRFRQDSAPLHEFTREHDQLCGRLTRLVHARLRDQHGGVGRFVAARTRCFQAVEQLVRVMSELAESRFESNVSARSRCVRAPARSACTC